MNSTATLLSQDVFDSVVRFLTGTASYSSELQCFWMAIQGSMIIRNGPNKNRQIQWFHSFVLSVLAGYGGGMFGFIWMGKPSSMLSNDLNMAACIIAWCIVNIMPFDIGYKICNTIPVSIVTTSFAQLFRSTALIRFIKVCFNEFKDMPSPYYPIPVFGPILYGTLLGNMSGFVLKGLEGHVGSGTPWPVQNGLFCGTFYHFYVHDKTGPIGIILRNSIPVANFTNLDEEVFAACAVSLFMQVVGILQLPFLLGPSFSPFDAVVLSLSSGGNVKTVAAVDKEKYVEVEKKVISQQKKKTSKNTPINNNLDKDVKENYNGIDKQQEVTNTGGRKRKKNKKKQN